MNELLPVLVTRLNDARDRAYLSGVALANEIAHVPLVDPPIDATLHVIEVHVEEWGEPLRLYAEPLGPPTEIGFPLRLRPMSKEQEQILRVEVRAMFDREEAQADDGDAAVESFAPDTIAAPKPPEDYPSVMPPSFRGPLSTRHAADLARGSPVAGANPPPEPRAEPASAVGRSIAKGKFVLQKMLGEGAVGQVYQALHKDLRKLVAVKILHASYQRDLDFCKRFYAEALAASRLDHPNIARVIDYGQEDDGLLYLVMEFLDGENVQAVIDRDGPQPLARIVHIVSHVCAALAVAHERQLVHRDIKPENVVLIPGIDDDGNPTEVVKVCDFGIAHRTSANTEDTIFVPGAQVRVAGTPEYMSPEQGRGDTLDARSDIYSCGITMYELATGRVPFTSTNVLQLLGQHFTAKPTPPSQFATMDPRLEATILKAIEKDPADRHQSARELRAELRALTKAPVALVAAVSAHASESKVPAVKPYETDMLERLARDATSAIAALEALDSPARFSEQMGAVERAMPALAQQGHAKALALVSDWLVRVSEDRGPAAAWRNDIAKQMLRALMDPGILAPLADILLAAASGDGERRDAAHQVLVRGQVGGAHAVHAARLRTRVDLEGRGRFVGVLRGIGRPGWPTIAAALAHLQSDARFDPALAEDLLLSVPDDTRDEDAGAIVAKFVGPNAPALCRAAIIAVAKLWGPRARALLKGVFESNDDSVRIAAVQGLRLVQGIDESMVARTERLLTESTPASDALCVAAVLALADTTGAAKVAAIALMHRVFQQGKSVLSFLRSPVRMTDPVLVSCARSYLALDRSAARLMIRTRAERSAEPLAGQLLELLRAG